MGSKRELLEQIEKIVAKNLPEGGVLLDIFAGTCGVGIYLRDKYPIYSNDIQLYSEFISKGTVESGPIQVSREQVWALIKDDYEKNYNHVYSKLKESVDLSNKFIATKTWTKPILAEYLKFIKSLPNPENMEMFKGKNWLVDKYIERSNKNSLFPYIQTIFLFSEMYFSLDQSLKIDSIKYAIDKLSEKNLALGNLMNVALIHAYSYCSAGTGHFAQFRDLSTLSSVTDVFLYRGRSIEDYFLKKMEELILATQLNKYHDLSKSFSQNYTTLLDNKSVMSKVGLIYADPPYSFVHYSRFYHAIEDLCRYDYPIVLHKGRYRTDRHQSPFCIKTLAPKAFKDLLAKANKFKIPVLISYSNTGMIRLSQIIKIANDIGYKTELTEVAHKHSTMGRLKDKDRDVTEALILCN
ncbi:MAG TPA: DNA adenine methylase [Patescibacteria group bacterium]|nr:DNA adenine methylase [Patescibacteria group bacterium]